MRFTLTPTPSNTSTPSLTPSNTPTNTPTGTVCPGLTPTATPTLSLTPSLTPSITPSPTGTIVITNTRTPDMTPTPTPTYCVECDRYVNNTFDTLEIDYQSCEGTWYYNELIPANQSVCIIPGTGGGLDWESMDFQSANCGSPCPSPGNGIWTITNYDCGLGVVYDVGINGNFIGTLPLGPSTFPLTSTLGGSVSYPSGVINGMNTIQINHSTNIQGTGNCLVILIYLNGSLAASYEDFSMAGSPITIIDNVNLRITDDVLIQVRCYEGSCV